MALFRSWKILYFSQGFIHKRKFIVIIRMRFVGSIQKLNVNSFQQIFKHHSILVNQIWVDESKIDFHIMKMSRNVFCINHLGILFATAKGDENLIGEYIPHL